MAFQSVVKSEPEPGLLPTTYTNTEEGGQGTVYQTIKREPLEIPCDTIKQEPVEEESNIEFDSVVSPGSADSADTFKQELNTDVDIHGNENSNCEGRL